MAEIAILWPAEQNEHGEQMLWTGSWLVGSQGEEGEGIYSGRGGQRCSYQVPGAATGLRIRRWPNEGLEAEYVDVLDVHGPIEVAPARLDFDKRQPFSRLDW